MQAVTKITQPIFRKSNYKRAPIISFPLWEQVLAPFKLLC